MHTAAEVSGAVAHRRPTHRRSAVADRWRDSRSSPPRLQAAPSARRYKLVADAGALSYCGASDQ